MRLLTNILTPLLFVFFVGTLFLSMAHFSMGMNMQMGMSDCPFMAHEDVVCPMNFVDHMSIWKSISLSITPALMLLLAAAGVTAFVISKAQNPLLQYRYRISSLYKYIQERIYTFSYRPLQELFSNGVLHPKLF